MKGTVVMQLFAFTLAKRLGLRPRGDLIFCCVADEEAGGALGARFLVDEHPELVGAEVALGEVGGYTLHVGTPGGPQTGRYYPIQVTEKVGCGLTLKVTGPSGHGSLPIRDGAMAKAARVLEALTRRRLPLHLTPVAERFVRTLAHSDPVLLALLDPERAEAALAELGADGRLFEAILHNTATPTIIRGGVKSNVIPGAIEINVDGRLLPRQRAEDFVAEVKALIGDDADITAVRNTPSLTESPTDGYFEELAAIIAEHDPGASAVPAICNAVTDARFFARLGAQTYGFAPVKLDPATPFWTLFHSADERIPLDGFLFGLQALFSAVARW
jgi:acetylornithine deacetylase/succinyl-diaminopimelate desuccinylase-like protein